MGKNRIGIVTAAAVMVMAAAISALSVKNTKEGGTVFLLFRGKAELRNTIELSLKEIDSLQIIYTSKNLELYPAEGDKIIIKEYLFSNKQQARARVDTQTDEASGSRTITVSGEGISTITLISIFPGQERIEIYIPKEGLEALKLQTNSGNITAEDNFSITTDKLQVSTGSGNIKWYDAEAEELHFQAGSGNIRAERLSGNMTIQTGSGNIHLTEGEGSSDINAGSGNIEVEKFRGQGSVEAGSGNVKAEILEMNGDMKFKTGNGNIRLTLSEELSFRFEAESRSGNIHTFFDDKLSYNQKGNQTKGEMGAASSWLLRAETNSGNINIAAR